MLSRDLNCHFRREQQSFLFHWKVAIFLSDNQVMTLWAEETMMPYLPITKQAGELKILLIRLKIDVRETNDFCRSLQSLSSMTSYTQEINMFVFELGCSPKLYQSTICCSFGPHLPCCVLALVIWKMIREQKCLKGTLSGNLMLSDYSITLGIQNCFIGAVKIGRILHKLTFSLRFLFLQLMRNSLENSTTACLHKNQNKGYRL